MKQNNSTIMSFNGGSKGFKIENATVEDAKEIAEMLVPTLLNCQSYDFLTTITSPAELHSMVSASTSPRMTLEFGNSKREDFLDWSRQAAEREIEACAQYPDEALALRVVDEESGKIAGFGVWGWTPRVSCALFNHCKLIATRHHITL